MNFPFKYLKSIDDEQVEWGFELDYFVYEFQNGCRSFFALFLNQMCFPLYDSQEPGYLNNFIYWYLISKKTKTNSMKKKKIFDAVLKKEQKYFELVWYARSGKNNKIPAVLQNRVRIENLYPVEIANLNDLESSDWHHGFNSGMLAAIRYFFDLDEMGIDLAEENFPLLDT